jgi:tRNA(Ile)-lysidine synthase
VQRRVVQLELIALGCAPDFDRIEQLRQEADRPVMIRPGETVQRDASGRIRIVHLADATFRAGEIRLDLSGGKGTAMLDGLEIGWRLRDRTAGARPPAKAVPGREYFDAGRIGSQVVLRHWRRGDRFQPIGMVKSVKLQDLFSNLKIDRAERHRRWVATTVDGKIWWVEGLRIAEPFKITPETSRVIEWRWEAPGPSPTRPPRINSFRAAPEARTRRSARSHRRKRP